MPQRPPRYRFLAELAFGGVSPSMDVLAIGVALAAHGHHVAAVVPQGDMPFSTRAASRHGSGDGASRIEWIPYDMPFTTTSSELKAYMSRGLQGGNPLKLLGNLGRMIGRPCDVLMANSSLLQTLEDGRYDAVLSYSMPGNDLDSCGCVLAHKLGVPLMSVHAIPFLLLPLGVPQFGSGLSQDDLYTLRGRAKNFALWAFTHSVAAVMGGRIASGFSAVRAAHGLPRGSAREGRACRPMLQLCANSFYVEPPMPIAPPQVLIGPIGPRDARPTFEPPAAADFLASAPAGAVLVSFGSVPFFANALMGRADFDALVGAFADMAPLRVLWLLKRTNLPDGMTYDDLHLAENTQVQEWVDINDALGHPSMKLFVTHGGAHSTYEAVHHGLPVVCVPFMFEQRTNCRRLEALGMGKVSPEAPGTRAKGQHYTREGFGGLMREVLAEPSYAATAHRASAAARLLAKSRPPLDIAVQEVEMAMIHRDYGRYHAYASVPDGGAGARSEL